MRHLEKADIRRHDTTPALDEFTSSAFRRVVATVRRLARDPFTPILLEGESGTGKTTLARLIHKESPRAQRPFQHVQLAAMDDALSSSALFGHVAGAFTDARTSREGFFATASGGTVFLDEIGKASAVIQQRLLHVIECGEFWPLGSDRLVRVDVRILAASNASLEKLAEAGRFLPDLFARMQVFRVELPPLRERRADIPLLVKHYVDLHTAQRRLQQTPTVAPPLLEALRAAPWQNNLRQLDATIQRLILESDGAPELSLDHCTGELAYLREAALELTTQRIHAAIESERSIAGAARLLGVDRTTIHRRLRNESASSDDASVVTT